MAEDGFLGTRIAPLVSCYTFIQVSSCDEWTVSRNDVCHFGMKIFKSWYEILLLSCHVECAGQVWRGWPSTKNFKQSQVKVKPVRWGFVWHCSGDHLTQWVLTRCFAGVTIEGFSVGRNSILMKNDAISSFQSFIFS